MSLPPFSHNRLASFDDITTQAFVDEYNSPGIYYDISNSANAPNFECILSVSDVSCFFCCCCSCCCCAAAALFLLLLLLLLVVVNPSDVYFQGVLLYPKNDTQNASLIMPYTAKGLDGCGLCDASGHSYFETWPLRYYKYFYFFLVFMFWFWRNG